MSGNECGPGKTRCTAQIRKDKSSDVGFLEVLYCPRHASVDDLELRDMAHGDAIAMVKMECDKQVYALEQRIAKLVEALIWCGGSEDFAHGGKAREGWLKTVLPLLDRS